MKTTLNTQPKTKLLIASMLAAVLLCSSVTVEQVNAASPSNEGTSNAQLEALGSSLLKFNGKIDNATADTISAELSKILPSLDFSPTKDATSRISLASKIIENLVKSEKFQKSTVANSTEPLLLTVDQFLAKVDANIDKSWDFPLIKANVMPPLGVPLATSGMSPDAIADPKLRQEYLDKIAAEKAKNLKNIQQTKLIETRDQVLRVMASNVKSGHWTKEDLLKRYSQNPEYIAVFKDFLKQ